MGKITSLFGRKEESETPPKRSRGSECQQSVPRDNGDELAAKPGKQTQFTVVTGTALTLQQLAIIDANRTAAMERQAAKQKILDQIERNRQEALLRRAAKAAT